MKSTESFIYNDQEKPQNSTLPQHENTGIKKKKKEWLPTSRKLAKDFEM